MTKLSWLGAVGLGREGKAASARHSLPVVPQQAGGAAFAAGGVQSAPEVSAKASWAAGRSLFPQNTAALTWQQTRLLMGLAQSQILLSSKSWLRCQSMVREAALWNERTEGFVLFFLGCI